ncbi:hypothetical protein [Gordonia sp. GONU]|nr:hypothetical protein [Gordonia sp. GONU]
MSTAIVGLNINDDVARTEDRIQERLSLAGELGTLFGVLCAHRMPQEL